MSVYDLGDALRDDIASFVAANPCAPERIVFTAAEPPSPVGTCSAINIWVPDITDRNQFIPDDRRTLGRITYNWRLHHCFTEEARDLTPTEEQTLAECFYSLIGDIWCGLVAARDDDTLMGFGHCDEIEIGLVVTDRGGAEVTATGSVVVPLYCAPDSSS